MLPPNEIEDCRCKLTVRFEEKNKKLLAEQDQIIAEIQKTDAVLWRLQKQPPAGACHVCYFESGLTSPIRPIPADPATPDIDRFRCATNRHDF